MVVGFLQSEHAPRGLDTDHRVVFGSQESRKMLATKREDWPVQI